MILFVSLILPFDLSLSETKYRLHAKEVAHSLDLSGYDGVLCVSGDGILVEVGWHVYFCFCSLLSDLLLFAFPTFQTRTIMQYDYFCLIFDYGIPNLFVD